MCLLLAADALAHDFNIQPTVQNMSKYLSVIANKLICGKKNVIVVIVNINNFA